MHAPDEETQPQRSLRTPSTSSAAELAEHRNNGHIPYRDWCPECIKQLGMQWAHRATALRSGSSHPYPVTTCASQPKGIFAQRVAIW